MGGGNAPAEDTYSKDVLSGIARNEYEDYARRFGPLEKSYGASLSDPAQRAERMKLRLDRASSLTNKQFDVAEGALERDTQRYGINRTAQETDSTNRSLSLGRNTAEIDALNRTRTSGIDSEEGQMRAMIATGRGVSANAGSTASQAAGIEQQYNQSNQAQDAARKAQRNQNLGTAASLAAMFFLSSKKAKEDIKDADEGKAVDALRRTSVKQWKYKPETGLPSNQKLGPIAEEMPKILRGPDGKTLDVQNLVGVLTVAAKGLDRRMSKME